MCVCARARACVQAVETEDYLKAKELKKRADQMAVEADGVVSAILATKSEPIPDPELESESESDEEDARELEQAELPPPQMCVVALLSAGAVYRWE